MRYKQVDTYQYFYEETRVYDDTKNCWHNEGTGPYAHVKLDHRADGLIPANFDGKGLIWRILRESVPDESVLEISTKPEESKSRTDLRTEISAERARILDLLEKAKRANVPIDDVQVVSQMLRLGLYILERSSFRSE